MITTYAKDIEIEMLTYISIIRTLSSSLKNDIANGTITRESHAEILGDMLQNNKNLFSIYEMWEKNAFDGKDNEFIDTDYGSEVDGRYGPSYFYDNNVVSYDKVYQEEFDANPNYYTIPKNTKQLYISDVEKDDTYAEAGTVLTVSVVEPILNDSGNFLGTIGVDFSADNLVEIVSDISTNNGMVGYLINQNGTILAATNTQNIGKQISDIYKNNSKEIIDYINNNNKYSFINKINNHKTYNILIPLTSLKDDNNSLALLVNIPEIIIVKENIKNAIVTSILAIIVAIIFLIIINILIKKNLIDPILKVLHISEKLSSGNLTSDENKSLSNRKDEIGMIFNSIQNTQNKLSNIIKQILDTTNAMENASKNVSAGTMDLSNRTEKQRDDLKIINETMSNTLKVIDKTSNDIVLTNDKIQVLTNSSEHCYNLSKESMALMEDITKATSEISNITKIIDDIAMQTNILALNASVEAARAGEQGKGFAVVAAEVRNLAQTSQESVKNITNIVNTSIEKIQDGNKKIKETMDALEDITNKARESSYIVSQMVESSTEQDASAREVQSAVNSVDISAEQNTNLVRTNADIVIDMEKETEKLADLMKFFSLK
ncbi:methyl-accepting chemotaxis protein [Brachyspira hyodysenteriae]|uniref:methyl-accepting chemotaxis protein n=1 Tax=Brachyspira hyodysenteriae TaxID=159 RepID=UPI0022CDACBD|nr:methyl-accepting chemotaxis protein [Brachyspira hyodysenteriae]MCZ9839105.1 methyl-accepting chemotaxis protein [Brachyspira hyodysenteriae]MCZ9847723.1 methyl-accepting chemotaxis protein [Brachyspira hyodysenteriae]MCZ9851291.1 methyl-accepting chemotaxis protein [Brachyspira hyodysenteriae]MCZ9859983.1 methyl-accepting chemotaxis protein [Brachyspira hyodysenteriae]MCZ9870492.1 methyl-accepting chemotaxis protein [Brachyspira hyodysenteriae]